MLQSRKYKVRRCGGDVVSTPDGEIIAGDSRTSRPCLPSETDKSDTRARCLWFRLRLSGTAGESRISTHAMDSGNPKPRHVLPWDGTRWANMLQGLGQCTTRKCFVWAVSGWDVRSFLRHVRRTWRLCPMGSRRGSWPLVDDGGFRGKEITG